MLTRVLSLSPVLLGLMALAAAPAQSSPRTESFGTQDEGITIIGYREFFPEDSTIGWSDRPAALSFSQVSTPFRMEPFSPVLFYVRDDDPATTVGLNVYKLKMDAASGHSELQECFGKRHGAGWHPGRNDHHAHTQPADHVPWHERFPRREGVQLFPPLLRGGGLRHQARRAPLAPPDQSGAGGRFLRRRADHPPVLSAHRGAVRLGHHRRLQRNAVRFCPERPITRGEMAVFLAKALGLHWPWDAEP
jgi:hypothetical protein